MKTAATGLPARRWVLFALVALLGLTIAAGGTGAVASGPGHAISAKKKKCKKAKKGAVSAKKKKCKKKLTQVPLPSPGPLVRGTLSWSPGLVEVDLHAFDASGNHAGWDFNVDGVVNGIPNATHSGDVGAGGPSESFTDNIFVMGGSTNREFSYVACIYGNSPTKTATFTGVAANGQSSSVPLTGSGDYSLTIPGGPPVPHDPC
jgi:hypothetical protein